VRFRETLNLPETSDLFTNKAVVAIWGRGVLLAFPVVERDTEKEKGHGNQD
jgi:hypothetical protein